KAEVRFRDSQLVRGLIIGAIKHALADAGFRASTSVGAEALRHFAVAAGGQAAYAYAAAPAYRMQETAQRAFEPPGQLAPLVPHAALPPLARPAEHQSAGDYILYPLGAARCQLHQTYIIAKTADGLVVVDQHAAHERLTLEAMKEGL